MLNAQYKSITANHYLHVIDIEEINVETKRLLDKHLISICEGESDSELPLVKKRLTSFLESKKEDTQMGAVAEFLVHLYLNQLKFKQEFLFFNLEENSIKKGFDGLFSKDSEIYLIESKSGSILSKDISHKSKITSAYSDLEKYVSGKSKKGNNNPWKNAYNHACHCDVATEKSIRKKIQQLRDMYDKEQYTQVNIYNIIPCSTIFLDSKWNDSESKKILSNHNFIEKFHGKTINVISITKNSLCNFKKYLGE